MAPSTNQNSSPRAPAKYRATSKYQFENPSKRELYGSDSWIYKVMGTEKLTKAEAKASYRNVAHFSEKICTTETLTTLYQALRQSSLLFFSVQSRGLSKLGPEIFGISESG